MARETIFDKWAPIFMELLMKDFKISLLSSAAIIGNAGHESAGFATLQEVKPTVPGSRGGWGIMQWTGIRRRAAEAYWKRHNMDPSDMMANYKFLFVELSGSEGKVLKRLEEVQGLEAKVRLFCDRFLRPGIPHYASRYKWAHRAIGAYEAKSRSVIPVVTPPEPVYTPPTSWWTRFWQSVRQWFS